VRFPVERFSSSNVGRRTALTVVLMARRFGQERDGACVKGAGVSSGLRLGFLGLGAMGEPMTRSLLKAGFSVTITAHRRREALERLVAEGATEAADPAAVARASDVLITCVPDAPQVEEVLFGEHGAASGLARGATVIDMSTISPVASKRFAERLAAAGVDFVDAPVSGGPARAATGTLTIMVGAEPSVFDRVEPVLKAMGNPTLLGGIGMGETVKLVNQIIISSVMIANAEALVFAKRAGADLDAVRKVIATATGSNYLLDQWLPKTWLGGTFEGGFALDLLRKDLAAALDAARATGYGMPLSGLAYQLYTARSGEGDGALDYSAIAKSYERSGN
jgi:3-hydroxyisobutyrate dehydrogenase-like beta-hydroxyacid dehydrogenase